MAYPIFPIMPSDAPISERLAWETSVVRTWSGGEQRMSLMENPRRGIQFSFKLLEHDVALAEARLAEIIVRNDDPDPLLKFTVPIWHDSQKLTAIVAGGATNIPCNTAGFSFIAGQYAALIKASRLYNRKSALRPDVNDYELVLISAVNANSIDTGATAKAWAVGDFLLPCFDGRLAGMITESDMDALGILLAGEVRLECLETVELPA